MKCNEREKLFLFAHQMLEPREAEEVRSHVANCADCRRAAEEYRKVDAALDDWSAAEPSSWFDARVRARVASSAQKESGLFGFGRLRALVAGAASVVLIVGMLVVVHRRHSVQSFQPVASQQMPQPGAVTPQPPQTVEAEKQPLPAAEQLKMDENLSVLEDFDVVSNFDALSELPQANDN